MGVNDGTVLGATKIVDHGPDDEKWNLVITGDGFTAAEMNSFEGVVDDFVTYLSTTAPPFSGSLTWEMVNVHRLDVESDESGADNPDCNGTTVDAEFCIYGVERMLHVDETIVIDEANSTRARARAWRRPRASSVASSAPRAARPCARCSARRRRPDSEA